MSELVIFHYHLLPGGVTSVITDQVKAIAAFDMSKTAGKVHGTVERIRIVTGRVENTERIGRDIQAYFFDRNINIQFEIELLPEIDYLDISSQSSGIERQDAEHLIDLLSKRYLNRDSIWLIHNYHLGKNPLFTRALVEIAERYPEQRIILQIHDFPESGRYEYLNILLKTFSPASTGPYPVRGNVRYAVINERDKNILVNSGIPREYVFLLENPMSVRERSFTAGEQRHLKDRIYSYYSKEAEAATGKLLLYPIRAIRRKNVFEAGLLSSLVGHNLKGHNFTGHNFTSHNSAGDNPAGYDAELAVTLPGTSETERAYSALVEESFRKGLIRGFWRIGEKLDEIGISFEELVGASDMLISTSVQEGFGFSYIQAVLWNKPLTARYLDVLEGFSSIFNEHPVLFYSKLYCPLDLKSRKLLREEYKIKIGRLSDILSDAALEKLYRDVDTITGEELVDFSFLDTKSQISILSKLSEVKDEGFIAELESINRSLIGNILDTMERQVTADKHLEKTIMIQNRFGYSNHAKRFYEIVESFHHTSVPVPKINNEQIWSNVIDNFTKIDYLRLIYG